MTRLPAPFRLALDLVLLALCATTLWSASAPTSLAQGPVWLIATGAALQFTTLSLLAWRLHKAGSKVGAARLKQGEALLERTGQLAKLGGWQLDLSSDKLTISSPLCRILGRPVDDRPTLDDVMVHLDRPARVKLQRAAVQAIEQGRAWDMVLPARTSAGRTMHLRSVGEVELEDGHAARLVGIFQDVSELHEARQNLCRTSSMLGTVLDATTAFSVIATDTAMRITLVNAGAERMLQYQPSELIGQHAARLLHDPQEIAAACTELGALHARPFLPGEVFTDPVVLDKPREWTYRRRDGSKVVASLVITAMRSAQSEHIGYLGVAHDVTERRAHEATLKKATEQAEQANLAKGQFLANMSHEIRTPMNAVLGMLKLLHRTPLARRQLDYASKAERAARALLALLNDILDFSKVEAGKMTLDPRPFQLEQLLRDLSVILSANLAGKGVELAYDIDPRLPDTLIGDDLRLQQILINLGGNAIKFTRQGEIVLGMRLLRQDAHQVQVRVSVRDTGIGIAEEALQRIFEGFSQAEGHTAREFGGTGLGLSISQRLVALMGGTLCAESRLGQGSTFHFDVCLALPATQSSPLVQAEGPCKRVLVIDDNPVTRELLVAQAEALGWIADAADCGEDALRKVSHAVATQVPYDAVFVDWMMPGMDGWQTSSLIRETTPGQHTPMIVMVTTHDRESLAERSEANPALLDAYLIKPVTPMMLQRALSENGPHRLTQERMPAPSKGEQRLAGLRILLVEDNLNNQQVALELLLDEGAEVHTAAHGQEGLDAVLRARQPFDIVLMDIQMPVMDGLSASRHIHEALGDRAPPIVAMTANVTSVDHHSSLAAGMVDHIGKPFDLDELVTVLSTHVGRVPPPPGKAGSPGQAPLPAAIEAVARDQGLDVQGALQRLGGRQDVYQRLLRNFTRELEAAPALTDAWWAQGDAESLANWCHAAKGLAATLGAPDLLQALAEAEQTIHLHGVRPTDSAWMARLGLTLQDARHCLHLLSEALEAEALAQVGNAQPPPRPDPEALLSRCEALIQLLDEGDMHAVDVHQALQSDLAASGLAALRALQTAVDQLDFSLAINHTRALMAALSEEPTPCARPTPH